MLLCTVTEGLLKVTGGIENKRASGDPPKLLHDLYRPEYWEES